MKSRARKLSRSKQQQNKIQKKNEEEDKKLKAYKGNSFIVFHFIMTIVAIYIAMLLTNWGSPRVDSDSQHAYQPSKTSYWVKIIMSWISSALYIWTLIAPKLFPNRKF
eukprot:TRINITY_DN29470_c0_g1_i1.p2 TRINITY_DN29470_c0_g1~~TRINITY_DN29470_c0_g1_i1.p2  ORF type:complete len:108 (-),score=15.60 TRINITY_DN29470_c0_g1_i1:159-482(-)